MKKGQKPCKKYMVMPEIQAFRAQRIRNSWWSYKSFKIRGKGSPAPGDVLLAVFFFRKAIEVAEDWDYLFRVSDQSIRIFNESVKNLFFVVSLASPEADIVHQVNLCSFPVTKDLATAAQISE